MASMNNDITRRLAAWADQFGYRANILSRLLNEAREEIISLRKKNEELRNSLGHYEAQDK
jgi:hypothetical protein